MDPAKECRSPLYQTATVTASAVLWRVDPGTKSKKVSSSRVDLTPLFSFAASGEHSGAVSITKNVVRGLKPATGVKVGCKGTGPCPAKSVLTFVVTDDIVVVTGLTLSLIHI